MVDSKTKLDEYAGDYILKMSSHTLKKLNDVSECNRMVEHISKVIERTIPQIELNRVLQLHITNKSDNPCVDIAKFYVKIAHVYASIVKTINPISDDGDKEKKDVTSLINAKPDGIPELDMLYNDSKYDIKSGTFNGRSVEMDAIYKKNLETFYMAFTGSNTMDYNIKKFEDIPIEAYSKEDYPYPLCEDGDCSDNALFEKYAVNIANNLKHINASRAKLVDILHKLFTKRGGIQPELTDTELTSIISTTRDIIIDLYLTCEKHYERGVAIYEAIMNKKILNTLINQQKELAKQRIKLTIR